MELQMLALKPHVTGSRATIKAIEGERVQAVFVAADAEKRVIQPIKEACAAHGIAFTEVPSMRELGQAACLQVSAAAAAVLKSGHDN